MTLVPNMLGPTAAVQQDELDRGTADDREQDAAGHRTGPALNPDPTAVKSKELPRKKRTTKKEQPQPPAGPRRGRAT